MARRTREHWLEAGLGLLAEAGAPGLTIERLCSMLGVTKGSFYHHFGDFVAYKTALLAFFEYEHTQQVITAVEQGGPPAQKLSRLFAFVAQPPAHVERAFRAWAMQDTDVQQAQTRIDQRRVAYVQQCCREAGFADPQAQIMGQLAYAVLIGAYHILPELAPAEIQALFDEFGRLYAL